MLMAKMVSFGFDWSGEPPTGHSDTKSWTCVSKISLNSNLNLNPRPMLIATLQVKSVLDAKLMIHMKAEYEARRFKTPREIST